jgi:hypothetical protein
VLPTHTSGREVRRALLLIYLALHEYASSSRGYLVDPLRVTIQVYNPNSCAAFINAIKLDERMLLEGEGLYCELVLTQLLLITPLLTVLYIIGL